MVWYCVRMNSNKLMGLTLAVVAMIGDKSQLKIMRRCPLYLECLRARV